MFSFKGIIASRGYHVYRKTLWLNAKLNDEVKVELETDQITFNQSIRVCYKSKAFLLLRFESSGTDSMRNLSHYICFLRRKWKGFWNSKFAEIYGVTDSFWRIRSSSLIDIFMQGKMGCQYHGGTHFEYNWNQSVGTNDSKDKKKDDYQTVVLEPENEEDVEREKKVNQIKSIYKSTRSYLFLL